MNTLKVGALLKIIQELGLKEDDEVTFALSDETVEFMSRFLGIDYADWHAYTIDGRKEKTLCLLFDLIDETDEE